ncbi:MAG: hypothetical protein U0S50_16140 [Sphingopyxis sp.]|uniref:hypothetical protein n=1 Tax=Sphingopyxis sp. TaxID=1908224 RepID=UPI002ABA48CB|nr:hypothetical protein [Sphingopyxis sp.]MDZ3833326.1 hypothetical protein [Sphingopyxis sp.]
MSGATLGARLRVIACRHDRLAPLIFCLVAALCAAFLSGMNFPEQNNRWQIPVVLDFAGSMEGPHDRYSQSFANFISLFWIGVRSFTHEGNIQSVFVAIQLAGNALLASAIFTLLRTGGGAPWPAAFVTGFLCFAYGLWGATALGYSELFVTYATHTQYAIALALFGLASIMAGRPALSGVLVGVAANINLFMAVWSAAAVGGALIAIHGRVAMREQFRFALPFLVLAAPVTFWGLMASRGGDAIPISFFREFLAGHVYGLDYPKALVQSFCLMFTGGLAIRFALPDGAGRRLSAVMLAASAVLVVATAIPYLTERTLLLLLHPLRFTSIPVLLTAVCAGALVIAALTGRDGNGKLSIPLFAAATALAGFALKSPIVSIFGFALATPISHSNARKAAMALAVASVLALFLPAPPADIPGKAALAFVLMAMVLTAAVLIRPEAAPASLRLTVAALGAVVTVSPSLHVAAASVLTAAAILFSLLPRRWERVGTAFATVALVAVLWSVRGDVPTLALVGGGSALLLFVPMMPGYLMLRPLARAGVVMLVPLLIVAGFANGLRDAFSPSPTAAQIDFLAAQRWARANAPPDALFLPLGVEDGFALFSRRPVWWEESQGAAVLWQPSFYPIWSSRKAALQGLSGSTEIESFARREGIAYLVVPSINAGGFANVNIAYTNPHVSILSLAPSSIPP